MQKFLNVVKIVHLIVWTINGIILLVAMILLGVFLAKGGPSQVLPQATSSAGLSSGPTEAEIKTCLTTVVGEKRAGELMTGTEPSKDEQEKIISACSYLLGGMPAIDTSPSATTTRKQ